MLLTGVNWARKYRGMGAMMDLTDAEVFLGSVAHEYGHLLGAQHPPHFFKKSFGDYELMDQHLHRLAPYSVQNLMDIGWIAPERVQVVSDTLHNVVLEDVRRGGRVLLLEANREQYFLVANHQGSDYDAAYKGRGLLIWHQVGNTSSRRGYSFWDLESAAGLFREGHPNPVFGLDDFDRSRDSTGTHADFFNPQGASRFDGDSNPNTNLYDQSDGVFDWQAQSRPSGIKLTNLRQNGSAIIVDVLVPHHPPLFVQVLGPKAVVEPLSFLNVQARLASENPEVEVTLFYHYFGMEDFASVPMRMSGPGHFMAEIPFRKIGTPVQYYVRAVDAKGLQDMFPAAAPDSVLSFIIKPYLGNLINVAPREVTLSAGDSLALPIVIDNTSDLPLNLRQFAVQYEEPYDERALDSSAAEHAVFVPKIFYDARTDWQNRLYYERAPTIYLRQPGNSEAVAKLHLTYDEQWLYIYFIMLRPRNLASPFNVHFVWRDSTVLQEAWLSITNTLSLFLTMPEIPERSSFIQGERSVLPALLLQLSSANLLRMMQNDGVAFRIACTSVPYPKVYWPSVAVPARYGKLVFGEDAPQFRLETNAWEVMPGEQQTSVLHLKAPLVPWSANLNGALLMYSEDPWGGRISYPLRITVKDFQSRFERIDTTRTDTTASNRLDPKPNPNLEDDGKPPQDFFVLGIYPNPMRLSFHAANRLHLRFYLPAPEQVDIQIYDVIGRQVTEGVRREYAAGEHEWLWDGRDLRDRQVQSGLYLVRLRANSKTIVQKIVVM